MTYTLLNPSAVGFDVVRRTAAGRVASVLLVAATATPVLLGDLARRHPLAVLPASERAVALAEVAEAREIRAASYPVVPSQHGGGCPPAWEETAGLSSFQLGGAHELAPYICHQLLDLPAISPHDRSDVRILAADLLAEAAVTAWTAEAAQPADDVYRIVKQVAATAARPAGLGPNAAQVIGLLEGLPTRSDLWTTFLAQTRCAADPAQWAEAMHEAAWAAWLSGRERPAVAAQMLAVIALADRGVGAGDLAAGVWNLVSGMVAVAVVKDMLPDAPTTTLAEFRDLIW